MLALDPAIVLNAHALGQTDASVLRANQRYFDDLEQRVRAAPSLDKRRDLDPAVVLSYSFDTTTWNSATHRFGGYFQRGCGVGEYLLGQVRVVDGSGH